MIIKFYFILWVLYLFQILDLRQCWKYCKTFLLAGDIFEMNSINTEKQEVY